MGEKVSIVIVNYNLETETEQCVESLIKGVRYSDYEIIIVDNGSPTPLTDSFESRIEQDARVRLLRVEENHGFGAGCNAGARIANGTVICFLNPDTRTISDFVSATMQFLESHPDVAIAGPRSDERAWLDFSAGFQPSFWLELCSVFFVGRYLEAFIVALLRRRSNGEGIPVGWVLGACLFIRTRVLKELNMFDTGYFLYYEEVDLCRRAGEKGYRCVYYPATSLHHEGSVSGKKDYEQFTRRFYESKRRFFRKHFHGLYGTGMRAVLEGQIIAQIILWKLMLPFKRERAAAKLRGLAGLHAAG